MLVSMVLKFRVKRRSENAVKTTTKTTTFFLISHDISPFIEIALTKN